MSVFPTRILLATDGSRDAELANSTAVDLANSTSSELHVVTVARNPDPSYRTEASFSLGYEDLMERIKQDAQETLDREVKNIEEAGGKVAGTHLRIGESRDQEIVRLSEELEAGLIVMGSRASEACGGLSWAASPTPSCVTPTARSWWCATKY